MKKYTIIAIALLTITALAIPARAKHGDYFYYTDVISDAIETQEFGYHYFSYIIPFRVERNPHDAYGLTLLNCSLDYFNMAVGFMGYMSFDGEWIPFSCYITVNSGAWSLRADYNDTVWELEVITDAYLSRYAIADGDPIIFQVQIEPVNTSVFFEAYYFQINLESTVSFTSCYYESLPWFGDGDDYSWFENGDDDSWFENGDDDWQNPVPFPVDLIRPLLLMSTIFVETLVCFYLIFIYKTDQEGLQ